MEIICTNDSHVWTVQTRGRSLHPGLDLIPGRQCVCGEKIIFEHPGHPLAPHSFRVELVNGPAVRRFAKENPTLVTWI